MKIKPIHGAICLIAALSLLLTACGGNPDATSGSSSQTTPPQTTQSASVTTGNQNQNQNPPATGKTVTLKVGDKEVSGEGSVELNATRYLKAGTQITVTLPEGQHYLAFNLCKKTMKESIIYLTGNTFTYTVPNVSVSYPLLTGSVMTARIPDESELTASHNLALNPADLIDPKMKIRGYDYSAYWSGSAYPHATTSSVCRYSSDEVSKYQFEARNAIDGFTQNNGHGNYPVQSWGPDSDFNTTKGYITVDFGHDVKVDTLNLYIRADFPHDTYFTSAEIVFSDGSTQTVELTNSAKVQTFDLGGKTTSSVKLTKLSKQDPGGWAGLMEIEVMGSEIVG